VATEEQKAKHAKYMKEYLKEYALKYPDRVRGWKKKWRDENRERRQATWKKYYQKTKIVRLERNKEWREKNKKRISELNVLWSKTPRGAFSRYKTRAKKKNIEFNIGFEEFITFWQQPCTYCGLEIETIGLDRIDSNRGYVEDNLVPCCTKCNVMKLDMPTNEFIDHCKKIIQFYEDEHGYSSKKHNLC